MVLFNIQNLKILIEYIVKNIVSIHKKYVIWTLLLAPLCILDNECFLNNFSIYDLFKKASIFDRSKLKC